LANNRNQPQNQVVGGIKPDSFPAWQLVYVANVCPGLCKHWPNQTAVMVRLQLAPGAGIRNTSFMKNSTPEWNDPRSLGDYFPKAYGYLIQIGTKMIKNGSSASAGLCHTLHLHK
jgi:hypothetical protein